MRLLPKNKDIGWLPYVWLVYLGFIPINAYLMQVSRTVWVWDAASIALFLPLYFRGYWSNRRQLLWIIAGITLLGVIFSPTNPGASVYFIYAAGFSGEAGRTAVAARILALLLLIIAVETVLLHLPVYFWLPGGLFTLIVGMVDIHFAERRRDNQKLLLAQEEVAHMAQIAERERIGRDLHDVLGHTLSLIVLKSELASKLAESDPQRAAQEIREVEQISRETLTQVRSTVRGYQSRSLRAEAEQARAALSAAGVEVQCDFVAPTIPAAQEGVLALALREAVTNVIRHANASLCDLTLREENGVWRLEIKDNGCGRLAPEGVGLTGMRQRVEALGGKLEREVASERLSGTRLIVTLPLLTS
jgi:two-component system sensor histidine kinase DesK